MLPQHHLQSITRLLWLRHSSNLLGVETEWSGEFLVISSGRHWPYIGSSGHRQGLLVKGGCLT